jgi:hypothetical protein
MFYETYCTTEKLISCCTAKKGDNKTKQHDLSSTRERTVSWSRVLREGASVKRSRNRAPPLPETALISDATSAIG